MAGFEAALRETSKKNAPWYVLPADKKWNCRALVATILAHEIKQLDLKFPEITDAQRAALQECKQRLESEAE